MAFSFYDSRDPQFKRPFGALKTNEQVEFRLHLPKYGNFSNPRLLLYKADLWDDPQIVPLSFAKMELSCNIYACTLAFPLPQLYFYSFDLTQNGVLRLLSRDSNGAATLTDANAQGWQLTVYDEHFETPDFLKGGVMYQILPDRFCRSDEPKQDVPADRKLHLEWYEMPDYLPNSQGKITNSDYFCGDLPGITSKLDYLQRLGVTCLYLNPVFEAHSNHRYNTADYRRIDPLLGTAEDLQALCEQGRAHGIRVILDGVFSHTGDDSLYFNRQGRYLTEGAYQSKDSPFFNWYDFASWPDQYSAWWGFDTLPNVVETNDDYIDFICGKDGVLEYWLSLGVSGFRLDVADELPDKFLDALTRCVKQYDPQALVLGEVWEDASNKTAYSHRRRYLQGAQLDSVMNYPFRDAILGFIRGGSGGALNNTLLTIMENYPAPVVSVLMNPLSTHDVERAITSLVGEPLEGRDRQWQCSHHFLDDQHFQHGKKLFVLATVLQFFVPGLPSVYYGDEVGMSGYRDPFNRCTYPWEMPDKELLDFVAGISALRRKWRGLLCDAPLMPVFYDDNVYCFTRAKGGHGLFVAVNRGPTDLKLELPFAPEPVAGRFEGNVLPAFSYVVAEL